MSESLEHRYLDIISGRRSGAGASAARAGLSVLEPMFRAITFSRNALYDAGISRANRAGCAVVSVGNLTTGGTGKTPIVAWLANRLRFLGHRPAVLLRGYKAADGRPGDEQAMLQGLFEASGPPVWVHANPDRTAGARELLAMHPEINVILLDDGFQHRRIARDFDLVLIDATNPFGFGRVLPRGLLRESAGGLKRATAVLITHADEVQRPNLERLIQQIKMRRDLPVFRCCHQISGYRPYIESLQGQTVLAFCGTGNPDSFFRSLRTAPSPPLTIIERKFPDHYPYQDETVTALLKDAAESGASALITTEKDFVKLQALPAAINSPLPIYRADLRISFLDQDEGALLGMVVGAIKSSAALGMVAGLTGSGR